MGRSRWKTALGRCGQYYSMSHRTGTSLRIATDNMCPGTHIANTGEGGSIGDQQGPQSQIQSLWVQLHQGATLRWTRSPLSAFGIFHTTFARLPWFSPTTDKSKQPKGRDGTFLSLDIAISLMSIGKEASSMAPAPAVFGVVTILLPTIKVSFIPQ